MTSEEVEEAFELAVRAVLNPGPAVEMPPSPEGVSQMIGFLVSLCRGVAGQLPLERGAESATAEATDEVLQRTIDMMSFYLQVELAGESVQSDEQP